MQKDRGEILRALLAANGGKMQAKEARRSKIFIMNNRDKIMKCIYIV